MSQASTATAGRRRNSSAKGRLVVASNRLPVVLRQNSEGRWEASPGAGGLVSAMTPVLRHRGGTWVGWPGIPSEESADLTTALRGVSEEGGFTFRPVALSAREVDGFYLGFANEIIWPLFHDMPTRSNYDPEFWSCYQSANQQFADTLADTCEKGDYLWVHDYHLMSTGAMLKASGYQGDIGFFLHIPFPADEIFVQLPWRRQVLRDLAAYDLIGFQTHRDRRNFLACMKMLFPGTQVVGKGHVVSVRIPLGNDWRRLRAGVFPISIDYRALAQRARSDAVTEYCDRIRSDLQGRSMVLGVDRLDYSKGIPHRLRAFRTLLRQHPEMHEKITLIQHVVPSRGTIPEYEKLRHEIDYLVSEINAEFTLSGWVPIHYVCRNLQIDELVAYYRAAKVMLVTSLKDGMNLVAKEFVASQVEGDGVLILSEFAGAAAQLQKGAMLVNPHDVEGVAEAVMAAVHMDMEERRARLQKLRRAVREFDIFRWVDAFLGAAIDKDLNHFPLQADFIPLNDWAEVM